MTLPAVINDYPSLKASIGSWLLREDDADIDVVSAHLVGLAEARIRRNQRWFERTYSLHNGGNPLTVGANPNILPATIKEIISMWAATDAWKHTIDIVPATLWRSLAATNRDAAGIPTKAVFIPDMDSFLEADTDAADVFTPSNASSTGPALYLWPQPTTTDGNSFAVDFTYIANLLPLSDSNLSNALLRRHPDLYLYGALIESTGFYQHDERLQQWEARYAQVVSEVNLERERIHFSGAPIKTRLPRVF